MTVPMMLSNGYQPYFILGKQSSQNIEDVYEPWFKCHKSSEGSFVVALQIEALSPEVFREYTIKSNLRQVRSYHQAKRLCYVDETAPGDIKRLYVANGCHLPQGITHICMDRVKEVLIRVKIFEMTSKLEKQLLKDLEQVIRPASIKCVLF